MKNINQYLIIGILILSITTCSRFEINDPAPISIPTFKTIIGSSGYDIAIDVVELKGSYVVVGASGSICDIVDGFAVKIDKENGNVISSEIFGDLNQGVEENFQSVAYDGKDNLYATGFTVKRFSPSNDTMPCGYPDFDSNILLAKLDTNLNQIKVDTVKGTSGITGNPFPWDQGISILFHEGTLYVTGQYNERLGLLAFDENLNLVSAFTSTVSCPSCKGSIMDVIINDKNQAFMVGQAGGNPSNSDKPLDTYVGIKELSSPGYILDTFYRYSGREVSEGIKAVQLDDKSYRVAVKTYNGISYNGSDYEIALLKLDQNGMNPEFIPIDVGENDIVNDMIKVKDGLILAGSIGSISTGNDFGIIKVDFEGNLMWHRSFHNSDDIAWSIIQTSDEGFLIVGRTRKSDGVNSMLIYKTDKDGLIF